MLLSGSNHASILCSLYEDINEARILGYSKYKNKKVPTTITIKAKIPIIYSLRIPLQQTKMKILNTIIIQTPVSGCIIIKNNGGNNIFAISHNNIKSSLCVGFGCAFWWSTIICETKTIKTILMNSLGWKLPIKGSWNHEIAPLTSLAKGSVIPTKLNNKREKNK